MNRMIAIGAVSLALVAGVSYWLNTAPQGANSTPLAGAAIAQDASEVDFSNIVEMTMGPEDAKVTVVEYASFTCPHCANFHENTLSKMKTDYIDTGKVHFVYRDVYFDRFGLWAAMIARCDGPDRFFGIADMLYTQQKDWIGGGDPVEIADNLRKIGRVAGLSEDTLEACLNDTEKAKALIAWFQNHATRDEVQSTPTLIINGEQYSNMNYADLKAVLDEKLAE